MGFGVQDTIKWMEKANEKIQANKEYLTSLDNPIGDGDHGINMARGFNEVVAKLASKSYDTVSDVLRDVAMTLMSKVGGASGPLYGTAFLKMSSALKGLDTVDHKAFTKALEDAVAGVQQRGKATVGEKTLVDVWTPLVDYFKQANDFEASKIKSVAKEAMENTKTLTATKGRAAYFKEKSVGHIDPGSASTYYIFEALSEVV